MENMQDNSRMILDLHCSFQDAQDFYSSLASELVATYAKICNQPTVKSGITTN